MTLEPLPINGHAVDTGTGRSGGLTVPNALRTVRRLRHLRAQPWVGGFILLVILGASCAAPTLSPYSPADIRFGSHQPPSGAHWLGTDNLGRDILSRILAGAKVSFLFAAGAAGLSLAAGLLLGSIAAHFGRIADETVSKLMDVILMLPRLLFLILLVALFGSNLWFTLLVVGMTQSPVAGKLVRAQVLALRSREYVTAAVASGASRLRVLARHIVPNALPVLVTNTTLQMAEAIMLEAGLSFLGLGDPNVISLGQMLHAAQPYTEIAWWSVLFPGATIALMVLGFHLIGESLGRPAAPGG